MRASTVSLVSLPVDGSRRRVAAAAFLAASFGLATTAAHAQTTFSFVGAGASSTAPVTGNFSTNTASNNIGFSPNLTPDGSNTTSNSTTGSTLSFAGSSAYTATDDLTVAVSLNALTFSNTAAIILGKSAATGTSNTLSFGGTTPTVTLGNTAAVNDALLTTLTNGLTFTGSGNMTITGVISGTSAGGIVMNGTGTLYLNATNTFTPGAGNSSVTVNSGTLEIGSNPSLGATNATQVTLNGGTLQYNFTATGASQTGSGRGFVLGANGGTIDTQALSDTIAGTISGTGALKKIGSGTLTLAGANTYSGSTTASAGSFVVGNSLALQNSTVITSSTGGAYSFGTGITSATFGGLSGNGALSLTNADSTAINLTVGGNNANSTYSGSLSGLGSFTKTGTGQTSLSGVSNTYSGGFIVNQGTLQFLGNVNAFGNTSNTFQINGGQVYLGGYSPTIASLSGTGGTLSASSAAFTSNLRIAQVADTEYDGTLSNGATSALLSITKSGSGTLTLTGANTYTGATNINAGAIIARNTGVSSASAVNVASGALLGVGYGLNTATGGTQSLGTLSALSLAVVSAAGNNAPALSFNLGASNASDLLTLTSVGASPLAFSGSGNFNIAFADATGAGLGAGTYTLISLSNGESPANAPDISKYNALTSGNLASISGGSFAYTTDGTGNVTALTFTIGGAADAVPEPAVLAFLLAGLPMGGTLAARRRARRS